MTKLQIGIKRLDTSFHRPFCRTLKNNVTHLQLFKNGNSDSSQVYYFISPWSLFVLFFPQPRIWQRGRRDKLSNSYLKRNFLFFFFFSPKALAKDEACRNEYPGWFFSALPKAFLASPRCLFPTVFINCLQRISTNLPSQQDLRSFIQLLQCTDEIHSGLPSTVCASTLGSQVSSFNQCWNSSSNFGFIQDELITSSLLVLFASHFQAEQSHSQALFVLM